MLVVWQAGRLGRVSSTDPLDEDRPAAPDAHPGASPAVAQTRGEGAADGVSQAVGPAADDTDHEPEWWEDPSLPWQHKPGRADIACLSWIGVFGLFSLAMLPLKGWLMGHSVPVLVALTGSRTATTGLGSLVRVGEYDAWWWPLLAGTLMSIKFDWVYWWAGRLWGHGLIEVWAGQSERASRNYAKAERWAIKLGALGMFVAYVPIPLPIMGVVFVLAGATEMSLKRFVALDFASCLVWLLGYLALGYAVGEPAVYLLTQYAKIANYVAIALVIGIVVGSVVNSSRREKADAARKKALARAALEVD